MVKRTEGDDFDEDIYSLQNLEYKSCKSANCDSEKFEFTRKSNNLEQSCAKCGKYQKMVPKEGNEGRDSGSADHSIQDIAEYHDFTEKRCFFCRRSEDQLHGPAGFGRVIRHRTEQVAESIAHTIHKGFRR